MLSLKKGNHSFDFVSSVEMSLMQIIEDYYNIKADILNIVRKAVIIEGTAGHSI